MTETETIKTFPLEGYGYTIQITDKGYVLLDENNKGLDSYKKGTLHYNKTRQEIERITGADYRTIRMTIAEITTAEAKLQKKRKEAKVVIPEKRDPESFTPDIMIKAKKVLEQGLAFNFFLDTIHMIHAGDDNILLTEWISALSSHLTSTKINTWQIGSSGKGKSHSKYAITQLLPYELYEIFTSASPLSLFYYVKKYGEKALNKTLLFIDEVEATKNALPMLRSLTSQTEITPRHLSVHESELVDIKIKGNRAVWFTSVKTFGSDQIKNRFINLNPDETEEQDINVFKLQDRLYREKRNINLDKIEICKAISRIIVEETEKLKVEIPYGIHWVYKDRRFLYPFFLAFIRVITKINFKQRRIEDEYIIATVEDFNMAKKLWINSESAITRRVGESALTILEHLEDDIELAKTHTELAEETGKSTRQIEYLCEELLNEGLVNRQKRGKERGRPAWEYWKAKISTIEDVKLVTEDVVKNLFRNSEYSEVGVLRYRGSVKKGGSEYSLYSENPLLHFSPYIKSGILNPKMCDICHSKLATWKGTDEDGENMVYGCDVCVSNYIQSYEGS